MKNTICRTQPLSLGDVALAAELTVPATARGLVVFVHGSGSSRLSPRNRAVASGFNRRGLATLLFDLLTEDEQRRDEVSRALRFDIPLLSGRLVEVIDGLNNDAELRYLGYGLFGASTGAAAALQAAASRPQAIQALVCRGGRSDLAGAALEAVAAPTLQIVGGEDPVVLCLNREASRQLHCVHQLAVISGATHLFEEPGALEEVARLAGDWFERYLGGSAG